MTLSKFDVYFADGKFLRYLCMVEAPDQPSAETLVRKRVPKEHKMLVKVRGT
jgi:hypothetical protein